MSKALYILNGPNLNLLGTREPEIYGSATLKDVEALCRDTAKTFGLDVDFRQSNHEGVLVDAIQEAGANKAAGIIINPAALTHTSVALQDALKAVALPAMEVHISNIFTRESWRHHSYVSPAVTGMICGMGIDGYRLAIIGLAAKIGLKAKA